MNDKNNANEIVLEKSKLIVLQYLSEELWKELIALNEPNLEICNILGKGFADEIMARLTCNFFQKTEGEYEFEWYKSWWQELRGKLFPQWWLDRYPSKREIKKKIQAFSTYPSIKIEDMEHKARIDFHDMYIPKGGTNE